MLIKLIEIRQSSNVTKFTNKQKQQYFLSEVYINPDHVVYMREDPSFKKRLLSEGLSPDGLSDHQDFTRVNLSRSQSGVDIIVVGSVDNIQEKLGLTKGTKSVLRG
mgnify:CR=1 FL=1